MRKLKICENSSLDSVIQQTPDENFLKKLLEPCGKPSPSTQSLITA